MKRNRIAIQFLLALFFFTGACNPVYRYINDTSVLRWEPDIRVFDSLNAVETADENTLLVTGSSSVRVWDNIQDDLAPYRVMQRGYGGAKLTDFNYYADRIIEPGQFKAILIFIANDISGGGDDRTPREVLQLFKNLVTQIRERNPGTPIFWIETTPTPSRWHVIRDIKRANELIRDYCERYDDLCFIGTYEAYLTEAGLPDSTYFRGDMLHQNPEGYAIWSDIIKESVEEAGILP